MAQKKVSELQSDLKDAGLMQILSSGLDSSSRVFTKNDIIDYSYPTGIPLIDYPLGYEVITYDESGKEVSRRLCLGIQAGTFNVFTGGTQTYKSTIVEYIAAFIAEHNDGNIVHLDPENRAVIQRLKNITGLHNSWFSGDSPRYKIINGSIGFDTIQELVRDIWQRKMRMRTLLERDMGIVDSNNQPIKLMPPTIVFLDSISDVIKNEYDSDDKKQTEELGELRNNTYGMITAKTIRGLVADILPMLKEANIIFITIAHKNSNAAMNAFAPPKKQFQYGAADEKMSGGKALEYNASLVANMIAEISADSRYHMDTDGFEGNTIIFEPMKCSTNESGNSKTGLGFRLVIDKREGVVDNIRSLILFLNEHGRLKGNKGGFRVIDSSGEPISGKFSWKNVYEQFDADPDTYAVFMQTAKEELFKYVSRPVEKKKPKLDMLYA